MKAGRGLVKSLKMFKEWHSVMPVIVKLHPRSNTARRISRSFTGDKLSQRQILVLSPHPIQEILVSHPDLAPEQAKELQELLEQQLPPDVCFVVEVNPTGYRVRRVRFGRDNVAGFGPTHVIPYCEPKRLGRMLKEFLKEQPYWLSRSKHTPNKKPVLTIDALVAFVRWSVLKEYTNPEVAKELIDDLRAEAEGFPGLEE